MIMETERNTDDVLENPEHAEIIAFIAMWDNDIGSVIVDFYPKYRIGDLENYAIKIFTAYQFFWDSQEMTFEETKFILPIKSINKKSKVLLNLIPNFDLPGGGQPYLIVLLTPDYFSDEDLKIFDEVMLKISQEYMRNQKISIKDYYQNIKDVLMLKFIKREPKVEISEFYSYTAAMEDFQAGIKLFQTKNFDEAYKILKKVLQKFEQEDHKHLVMEVLYILASLFTQKKQFLVAREYFSRLEDLARDLEKEKYVEVSMFMEGFCAYKNKNYPKALEKFENINIVNVKHINKLQFHTIYGRILVHFEKFKDALEEFLKALLICTEMQLSLALKKQQSQILYELGVLNFKIMVKILKNQGIAQTEKYQTYLYDAINHFTKCVDLLIELKDYNVLIDVYKLIGNIYDFLGDDLRFLEFYGKALEYATIRKNSGKEIKIIKRIVQKQTKLQMYQENIVTINNILLNIAGYKFVDLYTIAKFHQQLGESLIATSNKEEGIEHLHQALDIYMDFKTPVLDELKLLNFLNELYTEMKDYEKVSLYSEEIKKVSDKLHNITITPPKVFQPMGDVKEIWIFSFSTGIEFYSYAPFSKIDHGILGGFVTAMQQFSLEMSQSLLKSMIIGEDRFTLYKEDGYDYFMLSRSAIKNSEEVVNKILSIIYIRFWKEFAENIKMFQGNTTPFKRFKTVIESLDLTLTS